ncbi:2615_t:CDS:2, partial [Dentiscutata heterogama]
QFIKDKNENDDTRKTKKSLNKAFNNFTKSWNLVYRFYTYEPTDESLYLSVAIEYYVQLQNNFLNDIIEILSSFCQSLKFIEKLDIQDSRYYFQSISLENRKSEQIITYNNVNEIEAELALELVYRKKLIEANKDKINIRKSELLLGLEIIICFLKQTSREDSNIFITRIGLQLKHIVVLYKLVEKHVANKVVNYIPLKYQAKLTKPIMQEILKAIDFEEKSTEIPANTFLTTLKKLILRYLLTNSKIIKENINLSLYLAKK